MKNHLFGLFAAAVCLPLLSSAQELVSTGTIKEVVPKTGIVTLHSDQTTHDISFYGLERANIFTGDGKVLAVRDLQPGQRATLEYAVRGKRWYISKVILSEPRPAPGASAVVGNEAKERIRESTEGDTRTPSATPDAPPGSRRRAESADQPHPGATNRDLTKGVTKWEGVWKVKGCTEALFFPTPTYFSPYGSSMAPCET